MTTLTFDTLKFANKLKSAGVPAPQAEAEALAIAEAFEASEVATKRDIEILRSNMKLSIAEVKADMIKWMVGLSIVQIGLMVAILIKLTA